MDSNFWNLRTNDQLVQWKDFRRKLSNLPLKEAVIELNELWSTAGFVTYYLQPDNPSDWPDPWTLLAENYYCDLAKALGMLYTIYFTSHKATSLELQIYYDYTEKVRSCVLSIDNGKYIINYWPYQIVNTTLIEEKKLKLLYRYTVEDLNLTQY